jgi:hypothetical protein
LVLVTVPAVELTETVVDTVRRMCPALHRRLLELVKNAPDEQITTETRFRRRLRLDTYSHYPLHAEAIRQWRSLSGL